MSSIVSSDVASPVVSLIADDLRAPLQAPPRRPFVLGLCGAQGSGKSTTAEELGRRLASEGLHVAILSIDDLYLGAEARRELAKVHPLLQTRGVPGTHDVALWSKVFAALDRGAPTRVPRFRKSNDTRAPEAEWQMIDRPLDLLIFDGWCVGSTPQSEAALIEPLNALERDEDGDGRWRAWVNAQLAGDYQRLFARLDRLVLLQVPGFHVVSRWRKQQEHALRAEMRAAGRDLAATMDDAGVDRFIQHYQRLTEHILSEMPSRADLVVRLDRDRRPQL